MPPLRLPQLVIALGLLLCAAAHANTLKPYRDEAEFAGALQRWSAAAQKQQAERRRASAMALSMAPSAAPAPSAMAGAALSDSAAGRAASAAESDNSITNVQTAGVDEGGIVKRAGDHLVVLRRGRLFTVRVGGDQLQPVAVLDAYAPGSDPRGAWYDELLIAGRDVVVIGYSYARGGTEIGLFTLGTDGSLAYRATYQLRSFDYYSARNYASRLIGRKLVFYSPTLLQPWGPPLAQMLPALRGGQGPGGSQADEFQRILPATRIYRSDDDFDAGQPLALHTVTSCDLGVTPMRCEASAVLGPAGRVFYVSAGSVYVWTNPGRFYGANALRPEVSAATQSSVFRLPLDGAAPSSLKTVGVPIDQMSFLEDSQGQLNVLLREQGEGEGMWGSEWVSKRSRGALALLRVPLSAFGDGQAVAQRAHYRRLPGTDTGALQNRYVGDWLLWGGADGAWALAYAQSRPADRLDANHQVERIEALGEHALLVGNAGNELRFTAVRLGRAGARVAGQHSMADARQGETRTHGFFYRATGPEEGLLGLPVLGAAAIGRRPAAGSAAVVFLRQQNLVFVGLGELAARPGRVAEDACKASCVDWYGNARPIFLGDRVLALMGYEIVEGRLGNAWRGNGEGDLGSEGRGAQIEERRRISFAPTMRGRNDRPTPFD